MGQLFSLRHGKLLFLSRHEILDQFARDIVSGLPDDLLLLHKVTVFCGVHKSFGLHWLRPGFKIAIQTEQLFDEDGKELWGVRSRRNRKHITRALRMADRVLDLGPANRKFYDGANFSDKLRAKIVYGPHVFPAKPVSFQPSVSKELIFFGFLNGTRRKSVIESIEGFKTYVAEVGTYYDTLREEIGKRSAVLNIHFEDGTYSEVPRLLTSYLCGKPVVSEALCSSFKAGEHYHLLGSADHLRGEELFRNMAALVSEKYTFRAFVEACQR